MNVKTNNKKNSHTWVQWLITVTSTILAGGCASSQTKTLDPLESERQQFVQQHPEILQKDKDMILKGEIRVGFTSDEVRASIGHAPDRISKNPGWTAQGADEQWIYDGNKAFNFTRGVLVSMAFAQLLR